MNRSILKTTPKGYANTLLKILAVVAVVALVMSTKAVSNFMVQNVITSAKPADIQRTAEDILYIVSGLIIFIIGGFVILPFLKIAFLALGVWLAYQGLRSIYGFFLKRP
jgi:hypothetical protein